MMAETALPVQKMKYSTAADKRPNMMALPLNFRCSFESGCSQNDNKARVAAENDIFIQKVDQVR